jgi:hypothetical protein
MTEKGDSDSLEKLARENIINECINEYTELNQLIDLSGAVTLGDAAKREDLKETIQDIHDDKDSDEDGLTRDVDDWFYDVLECFCTQFDGSSTNSRLEYINALDGTTFNPKSREIAKKIIKSRDNGEGL